MSRDFTCTFYQKVGLQRRLLGRAKASDGVCCEKCSHPPKAARLHAKLSGERRGEDVRDVSRVRSTVRFEMGIDSAVCALRRTRELNLLNLVGESGTV